MFILLFQHPGFPCLKYCTFPEHRKIARPSSNFMEAKKYICGEALIKSPNSTRWFSEEISTQYTDYSRKVKLQCLPNDSARCHCSLHSETSPPPKKSKLFPLLFGWGKADVGVQQIRNLLPPTDPPILHPLSLSMRQQCDAKWAADRESEGKRWSGKKKENKKRIEERERGGG